MLEEEERNEIVVMLNRGVDVNEVGRGLGRDKGAISLEIKRNQGRKNIGSIKRKKEHKGDKKKVTGSSMH
jgi:IS30 family transposase